MRTLKDSIASAVIILTLGSSLTALAQEVIVSESTSTQKSVIKSRVGSQPVTSVEATPLVESKAEHLRKQRENAEINTENKIVEKLEQSRLDDEKKRADKLFGNRLESDSDTNEKVKEKEAVQQQPIAPQVLQPQVIVVQPQISAIKEEEKIEKIEKVESSKSIQDEKNSKLAVDETDYVETAKMYVSGGLGTISYPGIGNARGNVATQISLGLEYNTGMVLEGTFAYSNLYLNDNFWVYPFFRSVNQYQGIFSAKYNFLQERIRPYIAGSISYTYRAYTDRAPYQGGPTESHANSNSIDLGLGGGADVMVTKRFSVGGDLRYFFNVVSMSSDYFIGRNDLYYDGTKPLEKSGYWTFMITGKYRF